MNRQWYCISELGTKKSSVLASVLCCWHTNLIPCPSYLMRPLPQTIKKTQNYIFVFDFVRIAYTVSLVFSLFSPVYGVLFMCAPSDFFSVFATIKDSYQCNVDIKYRIQFATSSQTYTMKLETCSAHSLRVRVVVFFSSFHCRCGHCYCCCCCCGCCLMMMLLVNVLKKNKR